MSAVFGFVAYVMGRPLLTYIKFNYPTAKFEAMGNPYISEQSLSGILDGKDIESFKESFHSSKDYFITGDDVGSIQQSLDESFKSTVLMMKKDSNSSMNDFFDAYLQYLDSTFVKHAILNYVSGHKDRINSSSAYLSETQVFLEELSAFDSDDISPLLKKIGFDDAGIERIMKHSDQPLVLDAVCNAESIAKLSQVAVPYKCEQAKQQFVKMLLDSIHLKLLLRCKQLHISEDVCKRLFISEGLEIAEWKYGELAELEDIVSIISSLEGTMLYSFLKQQVEQYQKYQSVQVFEVALDMYVLEKVKQLSIKYYSSIGPTLRFLISKQFEIMNLKIIVKGISEQFPKELIKNLLVVEVKS